MPYATKPPYTLVELSARSVPTFAGFDVKQPTRTLCKNNRGRLGCHNTTLTLSRNYDRFTPETILYPVIEANRAQPFGTASHRSRGHI